MSRIIAIANQKGVSVRLPQVLIWELVYPERASVSVLWI